MKQDDVIRLAREAGGLANGEGAIFGPDTLIAFAKLVAEHEREACAKFIEDGYVRQFENPWREDLASAIRARGQA